jgi:hypothetical protein
MLKDKPRVLGFLLESAGRNVIRIKENLADDNPPSLLENPPQLPQR